jgi:anti-anti-sigma factor
MAALLEITTAADADTASIVCAGELDVFTWEQVDGAVALALAERPRVLVLDLDRVTFIDSTGLRSVLEAITRTERAGVRLDVVANAQITRLLGLTGVEGRRLNVRDTGSEAGRADEDRLRALVERADDRER